MNLKYTSSIILVILSIYSNAQVKLTGIVQDVDSKKSLSECHVKLTANNNVSFFITDNKGKFEVPIRNDERKINLQISNVGYKTFKKDININKDSIININLKKTIYKINEVTALSDRKKFNGLSEYYFTPNEAKLNVTVMGEPDILRQIQYLPGVSQGMDGTLGMFVRGGNNGNNRVELDEVPVYGNTHLFGLTSVFQSDLIENVSFKMGGISSKYGDFLSSVTQVELKNPINNDNQTNISFSPYMLGMNISQKNIREDLGIILGGRYSLLKQEYQIIKRQLGGEADFNPQVLDAMMKINWKIDSSNSLYATLFVTNDYLHYNNISDITQSWGNRFYKLGWKNEFNSTTLLKTSVYFNQFENKQKQKSYDSFGELTSGLLLSSGLKELTIKSSIYKYSGGYEFNSGIDIHYKEFNPASEKVVVASDRVENYSNSLKSNLSSVYVTINNEKSSKLTYSLGLRGYLYNSNKYKKAELDVRALIDYAIVNNFGFELSYDKFSQFYHVLEGLPTGWSLDLMVPASQKLIPEKSDQVYTGIFGVIENFNINIGGYYKVISNIASYRNTQNMFGINDASWEDELVVGNGKSYGLEVFIKRKGNRWNWNAGYTLSKTIRQYPELNNGEIFPFKFDRRHILNMQSTFITVKKSNKTQTFNSTISISSGHKTTIATGKYLGESMPYWRQREGGIYIPTEMNNQNYHRQLMSSKNAYGMPNYFRFDIGYTFRRIKKKYQREFTVSIFNVTNNKNPYLYFNENNEWYQLSIFPIMPSFRYNISF